MDSGTLNVLGIVLIFIGIFILIAAAILMSILYGKKGKTKTSGIIIVGPVPIVFGKDKKNVRTILALSTTLTALLIAAMLVYYFLLR